MGFGPLVLGALALCLAVTARCAEPLSGTLKKIKETSSITLGYRESSIPFSYLDDKQQPITIEVQLPEGPVKAYIWRLQVGRNPLYLLDANVPFLFWLPGRASRVFSLRRQSRTEHRQRAPGRTCRAAP